jgi:hypothetical protein
MVSVLDKKLFADAVGCKCKDFSDCNPLVETDLEVRASSARVAETAGDDSPTGEQSPKLCPARKYIGSFIT